MKNKFGQILILILGAFLIFTSGCGDETSLPSESPDYSFLRMIPADTSGFFTLNIKKLSSLPIFEKIKEDFVKKDTLNKKKQFKDYADFVEKTGINPKKDLNSIVFAVFGSINPDKPDFSVIANLRYDKGKLLNIMKEKIEDLKEETYLGKSLFTFEEMKGKKVGFSMISGNKITFGSIPGVRKVIKLSNGEGKSAESNAKITSLFKRMKGNPMASFLFLIPEKQRVKKDAGMFKIDFTKAEAVYGNIDYTGMDWSSNIVLVSKNEEGNKQLKSTIEGLMGLGSAFGPEVAELVKNIEITAAADTLSISIIISSELLEKLKKKAEEKMKGIKDKSPSQFH